MRDKMFILLIRLRSRSVVYVCDVVSSVVTSLMVYIEVAIKYFFFENEKIVDLLEATFFDQSM